MASLCPSLVYSPLYPLLYDITEIQEQKKTLKYGISTSP